MKYLESYKIFESLVDKKIQLLKDLSLELEDAGLQVEVVNGSHSHLLRDPRVSIHTGSRYTDDYKKFIIVKVTDDNEVFDTDLFRTEIIDEFKETLKSYSMEPRSMSGGRNFCVFKFDKHGHMTNSPIVRESQIFESSKSLVDGYLAKLDTTRQDVIDIFQGIVDLGYEPKFKMTFLDKDGRARDEKLSGQETPLLTVAFVSDRESYVGGSIKFNNLDYIENLYHSLSMFMSMFKDKCNIEYELDSKIELRLRLKFDTEYDENKVAISKNEMHTALLDCLSVIPQGYTANIEVGGHRSIRLKVKPDNTIGQKLLDELKASKTAKVVSNYDETEKIGSDVIKELEKVLSERLKKDIRYVLVRGSNFYKETGLYLFNGDKREQMISNVRISNWDNTKTYKADIKRGFLKIDKCEIEVESLEIEITL